MIDKTLRFQIVLHKQLATHFPEGQSPEADTTLLGRGVSVDCAILFPSRNTPGSRVEDAGE
jgi:hypothetical protein